MSYLRPIRFEPGQFLRDCDLCGVRYRSGELVRGEDGFWRCKKYCVEVPAITRDRISMQSNQRREAPPAPWGKPYDQKDAFTEEVTLFDFLVTHPFPDPRWPGGIRFGCAPATSATSPLGGFGALTLLSNGVVSWSYSAIYETCRYLYYLIIENRRPTQWISLATAKLREQADLLLTFQNLTGDPDTNLAYGGFSVSALTALNNVQYNCTDNGGIGLALLYAYKILGEAKYLTAAKAVANVIRSMQWTSNYTTEFTSSDSAGTNPLYTGGHTGSIVDDGTRLVPDSRFFYTGLVAVEFLSFLKTIAGDGSYGGLGNMGVQSFTATSSATLSSMIADALSFWKNGIVEVFSGKKITGLSSTSPRHVFSAFPSAKTGGSPAGTGNWEYTNGGASIGTQIFGSNIAFALRSLFAVNGFDSQVADVWNWLMTFTTNSATRTTSGLIDIDAPVATSGLASNPPTPPPGQGNVPVPGSLYDPKIALCSTLTVRDSTNNFAPIAINAIAFYAVNSAGLMSGIQSSKDGSSFRKAKEQLTRTRFRIIPGYAATFTQPVTGSLFLMGTCGLDFQASGFTSRPAATDLAAQCGGMFRCQPNGFISEGRPDRTQPGANPGTMQD